MTGQPKRCRRDMSKEYLEQLRAALIADKDAYAESNWGESTARTLIFTDIREAVLNRLIDGSFLTKSSLDYGGFFENPRKRIKAVACHKYSIMMEKEGGLPTVNLESGPSDAVAEIQELRSRLSMIEGLWVDLQSRFCHWTDLGGLGLIYYQVELEKPSLAWSGLQWVHLLDAKQRMEPTDAKVVRRLIDKRLADKQKLEVTHG